MRFKFNGADYQLEFQREFKPVRVGFDEVNQVDLMGPSKWPYTTANLFITEPGTLPGKLLRTYTVGAHHTEQFSYEEGRLNALRQLSKTNSLSKELKKAMWDAYLYRPRPVSKPKEKVEDSAEPTII